MAKIIEVTTPNDDKFLINTRWIELIAKNGSGTTILFAFNPAGCSEQNYLYTKESYEEIKMKVWGCNGE